MVSPMRAVLGTIAVLGLLVVSACTPAAGPTPTSAPAKPAATTAPTTAPKPAATASAAAKPVASPSAAAKPAAATDRTAEWEQTLAAAKKEGKVVVAGARGDTYRDAMLNFHSAYPDIQIEFTGASGTEIGQKIVAERDGGQYLWDVFMGGAGTSISLLRPKGVLDSLKPVLMLPEVVDGSKWMGGLDEVWLDAPHQFTFGFESGFMPTVLVNRSIVSDAELNSMDQLLDPKWKGKIVAGDVRLSGGGPNGMISIMYVVKGEDWLRRFLAQDLVIQNDERATVEAAIRGQYPVMVMASPSTFANFRSTDLAPLVANLKPLNIDEPAGATLDSGNGSINLVNKAPHPNAAKVFINWILTKDAQTFYVEKLGANSRRLDVEGKGEYKPNPNVKYVHSQKEEIIPERARATEIAKEMIK